MVYAGDASVQTEASLFYANENRSGYWLQAI